MITQQIISGLFFSFVKKKINNPYNSFYKQYIIKLTAKFALNYTISIYFFLQ
jgi:hypothetical protein